MASRLSDSWNDWVFRFVRFSSGYDKDDSLHKREATTFAASVALACEELLDSLNRGLLLGLYL